MGLLQIKLDDEKLVQLKHIAIDNNTNVSELVRPLIDLFLLEESK